MVKPGQNSFLLRITFLETLFCSCVFCLLPDIVFFGQNLPAEFFTASKSVSRGSWSFVWGCGLSRKKLLFAFLLGLPVLRPSHHHGHISAGPAFCQSGLQVNTSSPAQGAEPGFTCSSRSAGGGAWIHLFCFLFLRVPKSCPRLLINMEKAGQVSSSCRCSSEL